ncbi:MAG: type III polyketide synthase [Pseudomonadota bacterium]
MNGSARPDETSPSLHGLATAVPTHWIDQSDAETIAGELFAPLTNDFDTLRPVFTNAGIERRYLAQPVEWYRTSRDWKERSDIYERAAVDLFCDAAESTLDRMGLAASEIDAVVTVSSTGIATPALDARAAERLGLREDIMRVPVFGLGCAGGVCGLTIAADLARAAPKRNVLLVAVELCSLAFRLDKPTKSNIVATALFGDGAASAVISSGHAEPRIRLGRGRQHTWPNTLSIMGWAVDPLGFDVIFDRAIPPFARRRLRPALEPMLDAWDYTPNMLQRMTFHPGGTKVLQAIEGAFDLDAGALDLEREVLKRYGNMSAPTVLFVLQRALHRARPGHTLASALGPGFTAAAIPIEVC